MTVRRWAAGMLRNISVAIRTALSTTGIWNSNPVPRRWTHITKVDPEEEKKLPLLYPLYLYHTDAVSVGGSSNVTAENTEETFDLLDTVSSPAFHEPSEGRHVTEKAREQAAFIAIPEVLNGNTRALIGMLGEGITYLYDDMLPELLERKLPSSVNRRFHDSLTAFATSWFLEQAVFEAYIIQNPDSAAAERGGVTEEDLLSPSEARERAMAADLHLNSEVVYLEYSGTYGDDEAVEIIDEIENDLGRARVWYGGGIDNRKKATRILDAGADTVIVGDIFHDVAAEEANLCEQAAEAFEEHPSPEEVRAWLKEMVEVESTRAVDYLSTIPDVTDPEGTGEEYLTLAIGLWLSLRGVSSTEAPEAAATDEKLPSEWKKLLREAFDGAGFQEYLREIITPLVDNSTDSSVPIHHLSVAERKRSTDFSDSQNIGLGGKES